MVQKNEVNDLGVHFKKYMKFNNHYTHIVNNAYQCLGFIFRNNKNFEFNTIIKHYNALVNPQIDYIEKMQKRFLRFICKGK